MKKELGNFLYELARNRNRKIWYVFDNNHNLIASGTPHVLWAVLGVMFSTKLIKAINYEERYIILDCECVIKKVKFNV